MTNWGFARVVSLGLLCIGLGLAGDARAEPLFNLSGNVAMADGVVPAGTRVTLQVDLDRDGELAKFETLSATVAAGGSYKLMYDLDIGDLDFETIAFAAGLLADFNARGFEALLDEGPLPIVLTFEREGYTTVVKRLSTMSDAPSLDAVLAPLKDVHCARGTCLSPDGAVQLSGFPGGTGIARAYAEAYDPSQDTTRFPGLFADDSDNLLISSGFAEINLYDEAGKAIHELPAPVSARFEAKRPSWKTLPDLREGTGRVELPMYSFDQSLGEWVREADGELQLEDGSPVPEESLEAIHDGSFEDKVFVAFETDHFSTFNCDAPIQERGCVKGRLVGGDGQPIAGVNVSVIGESYTGTAGMVVTGKDGYFATDVMKSETTNEDIDGNGTRGETFTARVSAQDGFGTFLGSVFDTPAARASVQSGARMNCQPERCNCVDLGDVVAEFERPRLCEVTIRATFSGKNVLSERDGSLEEGEPVVGASVRGELAGGLALSQAAVAELCADAKCGAVKADEEGTATLAIPIMAAAPQIRVDATLSIQDGETYHYYSGQVTVAGCAEGQVAIEESVALELDHSALSGLGGFIASLGAGPDRSSTTAGSFAPSLPKIPEPDRPRLGCGCRVGASGADVTAPLSACALVALGLALRRRARVRSCGSR